MVVAERTKFLRFMVPPNGKQQYSVPSVVRLHGRGRRRVRWADFLWRDLRLSARWPCLLLLALAVANFAAGLALGLHTIAGNTRLVVDVAHARFGFLAAALVLYCSVVMPAVGSAVALAARVGALAVVAVVAATLAALAGIAYQCWNGHRELQLTLYGASLYVGMGWHLLHFGTLAAAVQAVVARRRPTNPWLGSAPRWLGAGAAVALYLGSRVFDRELIRFGTPMWPLSDVDGYAHVFYWQVAVGIYWTGFCALLLAVARLFIPPRRGLPWRRTMRRMTPNLVAVGWGGLLVWTIAGSWIATETAAAGRPEATGGEPASMPQPVLSSLDVQVDIYPDQRVVASRGAAVVVNRLVESVPVLRIGIPPGLTINHIALTGELTQHSDSALHYRLNRPLEPAETLRVDFEASLALAAAPAARRLAVPGSVSFLRSADVLPAIGYSHSAFADSARSSGIAFRARLSTTADRVAVAPGLLLRHWKEEGRSYYDYRSQQPVPPVVYIHSARYAVTRQQWQGVSIEAYHLPAHHANVTRLIDAAKVRLEGRPWPYPWLRVVEVADYKPLAKAPGLLAFGWRTGNPRPSFAPLGGVLPYSNLRGLYR